jgi:hypothetical protein
MVIGDRHDQRAVIVHHHTRPDPVATESFPTDPELLAKLSSLPLI